MEKDEALKLAHTKVDHEHSRWNTWVIFFFGSIASIFTLWSQFKASIPSYVPCILGAAMSLIWVFVALGIRRVTASWVKVIDHIEASDPNILNFKPNALYKVFEAKHKICEDFFCNHSLLRVTKVLTYAGVVSFILFIVLACFFYNSLPQKANPAIEIKDLSKMIENIQTDTKQIYNIKKRLLSMESTLCDIENKIVKYNKANSDDAKSLTSD